MFVNDKGRELDRATATTGMGVETVELGLPPRGAKSNNHHLCAFAASPFSNALAIRGDEWKCTLDGE